MWKTIISIFFTIVLTISPLHAGTPITLLTENFTTGTLPTGWTVINNTEFQSAWRFDNPNARSNTTGGAGGFAIADSDYYGFDTPFDSELRTPAFIVSTGSTVTLSFKTVYRNGYIDTCDVDYSTDSGTTWTNLWKKNGAPYSSTNETLSVTNITAGQNTIMFRFHYYNANFDWYWMIDDITITGTPATPPNAPVIGTATKAIGQATISFTPSTSDGGAPITSYTVTSLPNYLTATGSTTPITITGLNPDLYYSFSVTAQNVAGTSAPSGYTNSIIPSYPPDAPTITAVNSGYRQVSIAYTPPVSNGGSAITSYTATAQPGSITFTGTTNPLVFTGLIDNTTYTSFTLKATNSAGTSIASSPSLGIVTAIKPIKIVNTYYSDIQAADDAVTADNTEIKIAEGTLTGPLLTNQGFITKITGGFESTFTTKNGYSVLNGLITLNNGTTIFENIKIK